MLGHDELRELTNYLKFEQFDEFTKVMTYGEHGSEFYIIIKGVVSVNVPNPIIADWSVKYRDYKSLLKWKEQEFELKVQKAKNETFELY